MYWRISQFEGLSYNSGTLHFVQDKRNFKGIGVYFSLALDGFSTYGVNLSSNYMLAEFTLSTIIMHIKYE